jgi:hypothetical protein
MFDRHDAGGDSLGIVSAIRWTISNFDTDKSRIFAIGTSSGGLMTNVLIGAYPGTQSSYRGLELLVKIELCRYICSRNGQRRSTVSDLISRPELASDWYLQLCMFSKRRRYV